MYLKEVMLQTKNVSVLHSFYSVILELPVTYIDEKIIAVIVGQSKLIFEETNSDVNPFYHFAFNIPSNKLGESIQWLQNKVELLWLEVYKSFVADFVNWHAQSIYFLDTAGNILELIARFNLDNKEIEPFSCKQFLNISEIGLVLANGDFDKKAKYILNDYQLNYFAKQPPLPHFRAVGDDEGLFIIVPENRKWFATSKPSKIFPLKVLFITNEAEMELKM